MGCRVGVLRGLAIAASGVVLSGCGSGASGATRAANRGPSIRLADIGVIAAVIAIIRLARLHAPLPAFQKVFATLRSALCLTRHQTYRQRT
jgi:hypothetical protein